MKIIEVVGVKMSDSKLPIISVIIRTKNEEKWIDLCLNAVYRQKVDAVIEVILVDNESTDHTVEIAKRYPINNIINIKKFLPGKALNEGIRISNGDYLVCISAHCIPQKKDWLEKMLVNFKDNPKIAGVYGRQLPLPFSDPVDKRDLIIVFGLDKRIQKKDYFFHNANSMLPRSVWEKFPFNDNINNIEDRLWGKKVIEAGYQIIYEPEAAVYHHHGLHQGNKLTRVRGVVSILERVDAQHLNGLPQSMFPENINVAAIIPIIGQISKKSIQRKQFEELVKDLKNSQFITSIYCIVENSSIAKSVGIKWLDRNRIDQADSLSLNKIMMYSLEMIEAKGDFPNSVLYVNHSYVNRPENIFDEIITEAQYKGCDTLFPGLVDYGHYWYHNKNKEFVQTDPSLQPRTKRDPLYKAVYGLGCLSAAWAIRKGQMIAGKVGILKISDSKYEKHPSIK